MPSRQHCHKHTCAETLQGDVSDYHFSRVSTRRPSATSLTDCPSPCLPLNLLGGKGKSKELFRLCLEFEGGVCSAF